MGAVIYLKVNEEIKVLKEKARDLESKTKQITELLEDLKSEFEDLQDVILFNQRRESPFGEPAYQQKVMKPERKPHHEEPTNIPFSPVNINMDGCAEEGKILIAGWWDSENNFRWGGKNRKHPTMCFEVSPNKPYELEADLFIPKALTNRPLKVFANDVEIEEFAVDKEKKIKKTIKIPKNIAVDGELKVVFESDFWKPRDLDSKVKDKRILSLAFNRVELREG